MQTIHRELTVASDTEHLCKIREEVIDLAGHGCFSPVKASLIALAVDEAVANIIEHSYGKSCAGQDIHIVMDVSPARFQVRIQDGGIAFNPLDAPESDVQELVRNGRKGGLGLLLMRRIMDEIRYSCEDSRNELQMVKYVQPPLEQTVAAEAG